MFTFTPYQSNSLAQLWYAMAEFGDIIGPNNNVYDDIAEFLDSIR